MSLTSKNFIFLRTTSDGQELEFKDSDVWSVMNDKTYHWNENSVPLPAAGYYGITSGRHTIAITLNNFVGRIFVQGSLANNPTEDDWFDIKFCDSGLDYIEFEDTRVFNPMQNSMVEEPGSTGTFAETVIGNFTYLRICISRDYIATVPSDDQKRVVGKVAQALINF